MNKQEIRQKLFNYLYGEYGISLMESDYNEIDYIIQSLTEPTEVKKLDTEDIKEMACDYVLNTGSLPKSLSEFQKALYDFYVYINTQSNAEELKNEAIGFAKWIAQKGYETHKDKGKRFWGRFNEEKDYTASELYTIYLNKDV